MPKLSVIIGTKDREDMVISLIDLLNRQTLEKSLYKVIIIDQGTGDKIKEVADRLENYKYVRSPQRGLPASRNEGMRHVSSDLVAIIDDDVTFDENYLANIIDFFDNSDLRPDMVGGKTLLDYESQKPDWVQGALLGIFSYSDLGDEPVEYDSHPKHVPITCNIAFKKECFDKVGGFIGTIVEVDNTPFGNEDILFANQVRDAGYKLVYNPKMTVYHRTPASRMTFDYYKWRYYLQGKSDAYAYYLLKHYEHKNIPGKIVLHTQRMLTGMILQHFKMNTYDKYYQKLRVYFNFGYIQALSRLLLNRNLLEK